MGAFSGLCARGGSTVDCVWSNGVPVRVTVKGGQARKLMFAGHEISANGVAGDVRVYTEFPKGTKPVAPGRLKVDRATRRISWTKSSTAGVTYRVLRNRRSDPNYETIADGVVGAETFDREIDFAAEDYVTYKVVAVAPDGWISDGVLHTCSRATAADKARYVLGVGNLNGIHIDPKDLD